MAKGISTIAESGLWQQKTLKTKDQFGKKETFVLDPDEFILARLPMNEFGCREI